MERTMAVIKKDPLGEASSLICLQLLFEVQERLVVIRTQHSEEVRRLVKPIDQVVYL